MELTRRDALAALATLGVTASSGPTTREWKDLNRRSTATVEFTSQERETLNAVAAVLYPSEVTGISEFLESYVVGRTLDRPDHAKGIQRSIAKLDEFARDWEGQRFAALPIQRRDQLVDDLGPLDRDPDPAGMPRERIRYFLDNELLLALYSSPTGGELLGLENPRGDPGGIASYQ